MSTQLSIVDPIHLEKSVDFNSYFEEFRKSVEEYKLGKSTGKYGEYLPINFQRLKRGLNKGRPSEKLLAAIDKISSINWLVLTEPWCGDAAQSLGFIENVVAASEGKIQLSLLYRDENLELMDQFLTNGGRSIPKLIQFDENYEISGTWGPRPEKAQNLVLKMKEANQPYADELHAWYAKDKNRSLDIEIQHLLLGKNN